VARSRFCWLRAQPSVVFSFVYAQATQLWLILLTAVVHGVFWSALLASSAALMTGIIPDARAPKDWVTGALPALWRLPQRLLPGYGYCSGVGAGSASAWEAWLQACSASRLRFPEQRVHRSGGTGRASFQTSLIEQRVFLLALTLFLYTFGYGESRVLLRSTRAIPVFVPRVVLLDLFRRHHCDPPFLGRLGGQERANACHVSLSCAHRHWHGGASPSLRACLSW
jgi:hypothetical protein